MQLFKLSFVVHIPFKGGGGITFLAKTISFAGGGNKIFSISIWEYCDLNFSKRSELNTLFGLNYKLLWDPNL